MAKTFFFLGNIIDHKAGDNAVSDYEVVGTTIKLIVPEGYYDGENDAVTIQDAGFVSSAFKASANIFGKVGSVASPAIDQASTNTTRNSTTMSLTPPAGYYDGEVGVTAQEANLVANNIKKGVTVFGITGIIVDAYDLLATGQLSTQSKMTDDDGNLRRGKTYQTSRFIDNNDNTLTDTISGLLWIKNMIPLNTSNQALVAAKGTWQSGSSYAVGDVVQYPPAVSSWEYGRNYVVGDIVSYGWDYPVTYRCKQAHTAGEMGGDEPYQENDYWELYSFPGPAAWANDTSYAVGQEVTASNIGGPKVFICRAAHRSSNSNSPNRMGEGGSTLGFWVEKSDKFVCIQAHNDADMATQHCHVSTYWKELPFCGSADNLTTLRSMSWDAALFNASKITLLNKNWIVPNVNELSSIADYGKTSPASDHPNIANVNYWSSTSVHGVVSKSWMVNFDNGRFFPQYRYTAGNVLLIEKKGSL